MNCLFALFSTELAQRSDREDVTSEPSLYQVNECVAITVATTNVVYCVS